MSFHRFPLLAFIPTALAWLLTAFRAGAQSPAVPYDIIYVRQPRFGDTKDTMWPEVFHPARIDPGADLMLQHPDGSEEVLVAGGNGSVTDPFISFDAQWCYYALFPDVRAGQLNTQRDNLPLAGSDIHRINLATRQIQRLTFQEWTPNTGAAHWHPTNPVNPPSSYDRLGYGILNLGPCPVPGGKVAFVSNRNGLQPPKGYTAPCLQLFVMDEDGENAVAIAPMNIGSALHPTILEDGRIMFSSYESQGLRDQRLWGVWSIQPDGRTWRPVISAFNSPQAFHFMTQLGGSDLVVTDYYNLNNNGFGMLDRLPVNPPAGQPAFFSAFPGDNTPIRQTVGAGYEYPFTFPFEPRGIHSITPFTTGQDEAAPVGTGGVRVGKFTHPSAAPNNDLLVVWSPGPTNNLDRPTAQPYYDAGLYLIRGGDVVSSPADLVLIKNDPAYNEAWPRAVVPYRAVHGIDQPKRLPWLPNDGSVHPALPAGTPYGLIGTSSVYKRESFPGIVRSWANFFNGLDAFNTDENEQSSNWEYQGAEDGKYSNSEIFAIRILAMEPNSHRSYGPNEGIKFVSHANERLRILGEIPLRKSNSDGTPLLDPEGHPDTSFLAKIPADTPFTFQTIDKDGLVLNMAQTWHQVRPGEMRANCGGCHAHSQQPLAFESTAAGAAGFQPVDLTLLTPWLTKDGSGATVVQNKPAGAVNVEFLHDIRPILQRSCVSCHTQAAAAANGNLALDDSALYPTDNYQQVPGDYARLASDEAARWGYKPVINNRTWRQTNASRYIRKFQSRRSLLVWKIFGRRMDGWTNSEHPTETTPGDPTTLPAGTDLGSCDLDYTGNAMPPPGSNVPPLSEDEKMMFARWVDLGCPINTGELTSPAAGALGWFLDEIRPVVTVSRPRQNRNAGPLTEIRIGIADADTGVKSGSLSIVADFPVNGRAPGVELADLAVAAGPGMFSLPLASPITKLASGHITVKASDNQGNVTTQRVRFWVEPEEFHVSSLDVGRLSEGLLTVIFTDNTDGASHRVRFSTDLAGQSASWPELAQLGATDDSDILHRLLVQWPAGIPVTRGFVVVARDGN